MTSTTDNFKKQHSRNNAFAFQRKFKGLSKASADLTNKADPKIPTKYIIFAIIYVMILILIYTYTSF